MAVTPPEGTPGLTRRRGMQALLPPAYEPGVDHPSMAALWDAVDIFRLLAICYAVYEFAGRLEHVHRPVLGWGVLAVLAGWTVLMLVHRRRELWQVWAELGLATAAILATLWVDLDWVRQSGASTVPGIWAGAVVIASGLYRGPLAAYGAWLVIVIADLIEIGLPTEGTIHNIVLLFIVAGCAGWVSQAARRGDEAMRQALQLRAETAERERLARTVHDGVLQALTFIHRRGQEVGGPARELGDIAARQERRLRDLIAVPDPEAAHGGRLDVTAALRRLAAERGDHVQVSGPAEPVSAPATRVEPLTAAAGAALDNVEAHAGAGARAWILVEDEDEEIVVTIRDDGVGMADGTLQAAREAGRIGVAGSIEGRLAELGGSAVCRSAPGAGTSWELRLPRDG